ncbi:protein kinase [Stigmatella aurantiaca DW4/3-1]|uniref:non-specific serine/threonine protein kinase n=1 Tax=Stigmatella aurantiaca (strain DW4/3-1) TaxID=378806 RepID=Q099V9_STIAD|nr:protein kinase [Stigmatella aurantiaca DW4/3-1]
MLVRASDTRAFLTDFGSGNFKGAPPLTWQAMPPCTPAYLSPQACRFAALRPFHHIPYTATPADDVFALGVTAYRLVTDEYPPPAEPGLDTKGLWKDGGPGPLPPEVLNPRVEPRLNTLILRMLSIQPEARGSAAELAQAMEQAAAQSSPQGDQPLFAWEDQAPARKSPLDSVEADMLGHRPRYRNRARVLETQARDAAERTVATRLKAEALARSRAATQPDVHPSPSLRWPRGLLLAAGILLLVFVPESVAPVLSEQTQEPAPRTEAQDAGTDAGTVGLADVTAQPSSNTEGAIAAHTAISIDLPKGPLKGQVRPPCEQGQMNLRGGCWIKIEAQPPDCPRYSYEWKGGCYMPFVATPRPDTSDKP